ncbi:MAG: hypothetical protein ACUVXI_19085 [bacterium]
MVIIRREILHDMVIHQYVWVKGEGVVYISGSSGAGPTARRELWIVNSDGTNKRRLADKVWYGKLEITPSPDGKFLALRGAFSAPLLQMGGPDIQRLDNAP